MPIRQVATHKPEKAFRRDGVPEFLVVNEAIKKRLLFRRAKIEIIRIRIWLVHDYRDWLPPEHPTFFVDWHRQ